MSARPLTAVTWRHGLAAVSVVGILVLLLLPHFLSTYYLGLVVQMMIFALFAMSLDLLIGYTGMASLGHAAYFGVAAYATGLLALKIGLERVARASGRTSGRRPHRDAVRLLGAAHPRQLLPDDHPGAVAGGVGDCVRLAVADRRRRRPARGAAAKP